MNIIQLSTFLLLWISHLSYWLETHLTLIAVKIMVLTKILFGRITSEIFTMYQFLDEFPIFRHFSKRHDNGKAEDAMGRQIYDVFMSFLKTVYLPSSILVYYA